MQLCALVLAWNGEASVAASRHEHPLRDLVGFLRYLVCFFWDLVIFLIEYLSYNLYYYIFTMDISRKM